MNAVLSWFTEPVDYQITRFIFQRFLAFIYLIGFLIVLNQFKGLSGEHGLLPVKLFVKRVEFWDSPSLFFWKDSDGFFLFMGWLGLLLSTVALTGLGDAFNNWISAAVWFSLWFIYLSFVNVGQTFYSFGWESLLLETGFLAIFLGSTKSPTPVLIIWLLRWLLFRLMFGAGMIKIRGDECWRDLTCLQYHYETQPMPNALSWYFHHLPVWMHKAGVAFNHFVELAVPFFYFAPHPLRTIAGLLTIVFQGILILSGNLSWLNCITIIVAFACFDDRFWRAIFPPFEKISWLDPANLTSHMPPYLVYGLTLVVGLLSIRPAWNLFSRTQLMNASFEPFHIVNTYGAFGSVTKERLEVILEGTSDTMITNASQWKEYEFKGKVGDVNRRPPQVTPYHYKLDWQMWFAPMGPYYYHPWIINLVAKLLQNQPEVTKLIRINPFAEEAPKFIRARLYRYKFTQPGSSAYWEREPAGEYLPPLSLNDPDFRKVLESQGWL